VKVLVARFTAKPGHGDHVAQLIDGLAVKVRREEGNVRFEPYREQELRDRFMVFEVYRDEGAFLAHLSMPYGKPFNAALEPLIEEPHSMLTFLDPVNDYASDATKCEASDDSFGRTLNSPSD
jgi:quinol monooxygenase YgiN